MRIGELSRQSGVPASALRYWEQVGLLPRATRVSGRREYGPEALGRVSLILMARACGFTVSESRRLFSSALDGRRPSERWELLAEAKLQEIARVERLLERMRTALETARACRCVDLDACGAIALKELPHYGMTPGGPSPRRNGRSRASG